MCVAAALYKACSSHRLPAGLGWMGRQWREVVVVVEREQKEKEVGLARLQTLLSILLLLLVLLKDSWGSGVSAEEEERSCHGTLKILSQPLRPLSPSPPYHLSTPASCGTVRGLKDSYFTRGELTEKGERL